MANTIRGKATVTTQTTQLSQIIGITAPVPMGDWQATTPYLKLNIVRYNSASYIAKKQSTGVEPTVTAGWQEVWQAVAYDGGAVEPNGDYQGMTVGKATQAENDGTGTNIAEQFTDINDKIPSTASAENQLADEAFVNSSINAMAAFYIEHNTQGDAFPTRADLLNATAFYNAGQPRIPTQNDYAYVLSDESQPKDSLGNYPTTRYSYQGGTYPDGQWGFQYVVNNTSLTQAQVDAINSGITKELVGQINSGITLMDWVNIVFPIGGNERYTQFPNAQTPAQKFPNTSWEIDTALQGKTIVGSGDNYTFGATGGSADAVVVEHRHQQRYQLDSYNNDDPSYAGNYPWGINPAKSVNKEKYCIWLNPANTISEGYTTPIQTNPEGENGTGKNMPPYVVVNYWKRIA